MSRNSQFLCLCVVFSVVWLLSAFLFPLQPTDDPFNSPTIHSRILFEPDAPLDYIPPQSLTAILPVLSTTLGEVKDLLEPLLTGVEQIREIILVCPPSYVTDVRREVRTRFASLTPVELDVSLWPWQSDMSVLEAILSCASQLTTGWILIMDENGLNEATDSVRATLLRPPNVTLPLGPNGLKQENYIPMSSPWGLLQPAQCLYPPFVLPSSALRTFEVNYSDDNLWNQLGSHISSLRTDAIGGLRLHAAGLNGSSSTTPQINSSLPAGGSHLNWHFSLSEDIYSNSLPSTTPLPGRSKTTDFIFFLPTLVDLDKVSSLVCRLLDVGTRPIMRVLIYEGLHASPHHLGWNSGVLENGNCAIDYDILTGTQPLSFSTAGSSVLGNWLDEQPGPIHVVFTLKVPDPLVSFMDSQGENLFPHTTFISVPRADLEYTDWMSSLTLMELKNWHKPTIDLTIITRDRPMSLLRLLKSLSETRYFGDRVDLRINIEQDCDEDTLEIAQDFEWQHGSVLLSHRVVHGGLLPAVVEAWYPKNNNCYGVLLEDDVELSPLFYAWVKMTLLRYRYGDKSKWTPYMFGISLYQQKHLELPQEGRQAFNPRFLFSTSGTPNPITPYLSQVPCSWGAVYFPEHWREFHSYLAFRLTESIIPIETEIVPDVRSNHWTKSWKRFFIELVYLRGYVMLYPNFEDFVSLSTNHLEVGSHVRVRTQEKQDLFLLPLMELPKQQCTSPLLSLPDGNLPMLDDLPVLNLTGFITSLQDLQDQGMSRRFDLFDCDNPTMLYDIFSLMCINKSL